MAHGENQNDILFVFKRLARLEGAAVLTALVERVETIEADGPPVRNRNNLIRSFRSLPLTVTPKASA